MVNLLDTLNTYWENFVGASAATLLTVLVVCSALLLGYLLIAVLNAFNIQHNGNKKVEGCDGDCCSCGKGGCSERKEEQK